MALESNLSNAVAFEDSILRPKISRKVVMFGGVLIKLLTNSKASHDAAWIS